MKRLIGFLCGGVISAALSGCFSQQITERSFYEPTQETLTKRSDGFVCGAVKSETIKSGSRDEGDKDFTYGLININP